MLVRRPCINQYLFYYKPEVFSCFQGVSKEFPGMKWVNKSFGHVKILQFGKFQQKIFTLIDGFRSNIFTDFSRWLMLVNANTSQHRICIG